MTPADQPQMKTRQWKIGVTAPADAQRPTCKAIESLNGIDGSLVEDQTDLIDWLIVIAYETKQSDLSK